MFLAEMNWPEAASLMFVFGAIVTGFVVIIICDCITRVKTKGENNNHDTTWEWIEETTTPLEKKQ